MSRRFPWAALMRAGIGALGLSPRAFWSATPREIAAAFPEAGPEAPARGDLERLITQFPDVT